MAKSPDKTSPGYTPPSSPEAEQSVLGAILVRPGCLDDLIEQLSPDDFYREAHARIYMAMLGLYNRNEPVDLITVTQRLDEAGWLEGVGGRVFLAALSEQVGFATNVLYYAQVVHDKALLRRLLDAVQQIAGACFAPVEDVRDFLNGVEQQIFEIIQARQQKGGARLLRDLMQPVLEKIEELYTRKIELTGLSTGHADLDRMTGGFQDEDLIILAGRPGQGKTGLGLNICSNMSLQGVPTLFYSLEMSYDQLVRRLLASEGKIDTLRLRDGRLRPDEWSALQSAAGRLMDAPVFIDDAPTITFPEIHSRTRRLVAQAGIRFVVIDYLQRVKSRGRSKAEEVGAVAQGAKTMAKELKIPVLLMSQLNRDCESRDDKRPLLQDLKSSGDVEQEGDLVAFIYRDDYYDEDSERKGIAEIIIRKHRNGPCGTVELGFDAASVTFRDLSRETEPPTHWQEQENE